MFKESASEKLEGCWMKRFGGRFIATAFAIGMDERAAIHNVVPVTLENLMLLCDGECRFLGCLSCQGL